MMQLKSINGILAAVLLTGALAAGVSADTASDITSHVNVTANGLKNPAVLTDGNLSTSEESQNFSITFTSDEPMGGLYVKYRRIPSDGALNGSVPIASHGFLHEYIPLDGASEATLNYTKANIAEIEVYSVGDLPEEVQV